MTGNYAGSVPRDVGLAPRLHLVTMQRSRSIRSPLIAHLMAGSAVKRLLRSTIVAAFLTPPLTGCGSAQAGARESTAADTTVQDWETEPTLWTPRAILIPRASRPVSVPDRAADA